MQVCPETHLGRDAVDLHDGPLWIFGCPREVRPPGF